MRWRTAYQHLAVLSCSGSNIVATITISNSGTATANAWC